MTDDERQIRKLMDEWRRRTLEGDLEGVLALMTDDAVFLTPGNPPMTKSDFAAASRGFAGKFQIESTQEVQDLHASGDLAYAWSHISVVMTSETGARTERAGHVLTVFRKTPSGEWLLARDANLMAGNSRFPSRGRRGPSRGPASPPGGAPAPSENLAGPSRGTTAPPRGMPPSPRGTVPYLQGARGPLSRAPPSLEGARGSPERARAKKWRGPGAPCSVQAQKPGASPPPSTVLPAEGSVHGAPSSVPPAPSGARARTFSVQPRTSGVLTAPCFLLLRQS